MTTQRATVAIALSGAAVFAALAVVISATREGTPCQAAQPARHEGPDPSLTRAGIVNVRDYGAALDGKTDDAPAIRRAFQAMKANGKATGTLIIPGLARIGSTLDFDGGYRNTPHEHQWSAGEGEHLRIVVLGALRPDAKIGVAVRLHGARNVWADFRFDGGGAPGDVALLLEDLDQADIGVSANDFAGTVLKADATADRTQRIRSSKIRHVFVTHCGQAIEWRGIEAFGSFEMVWDRNCKRGSHFFQCADVGIQHYENYSPASHTIGLHFEQCNMFNVGVITVGDRASQALVQITGGDFGSIQRLRATGRFRPPKDYVNPTVGLRLVNVKSLNIDNLHTARCRIGLHAIGSTFTVQRHQSMTGDINPLVIEGSERFGAPRIDIGAWYRYHMRESVKIAENVKGGRLRLHGQLYLMNIAGTRDKLYAIDCRSRDMVLDVSGLEQEHRDGLKGSIYHAAPERIVGVSRARLADPLVHGQIAKRQLKAAKTLRNDSGQTLHLAVPVRFSPTAGAAASARVLMGPTAARILPVAARELAAGTPPQTDTLRLAVPPWWHYRLEAANAALDEATARLE